MTNNRGRYSNEFKLEAIKLVEEQGRHIKKPVPIMTSPCCQIRTPKLGRF